MDVLILKPFFFTHMKLCLATATHDFKWMKITNNLRPNICKSECLHTHFILNNSDLIC